MQNNVICKEKKQGFIARTKAKFNALAKNKKGVSQMVEMLIILGIVVAVGAVVAGVIWKMVDNNTPTEDKVDPNRPKS